MPYKAPPLEAVILLSLILAAIHSRFRSHRPLEKKQFRDELDRVLFHWTENDPFTVRDLLNGGVAILGRTGSGKTSSSGKLLARKVVQCPKSGGLILAAKPEDRDFWRAIFREAARERDLRIFSPSEPLRFNFLDYELRHGDTRNIVHCLMTISETLRNGDAGTSTQEPFWRQQQERMFYAAVEVVKLATGKVSAPDLQRFILGAASTLDELNSPQWRAGDHLQWLEAANRAEKSSITAHDFRLATDYWLTEYPQMADRTRSSILSGVFGLLQVFNSGICRELVSGETNISPDDMLKAKWLLIDTAPSEYGESGRFFCAGWKYLTQRMMLRRAAGPGDSIHTIWADESSQFVNSFDAQYLSQCRSHRGCMVMLGHGLPSYYAAFQGDAREDHARSLLANFGHFIIHATDPQTAEWAAKKLGKRREQFFGGSSGSARDSYDRLLGELPIQGNFSDRYENVLQESVFMNGLRTGGKARVADAIVMRSGEQFSTGDNYLFRTFPQD